MYISQIRLDDVRCFGKGFVINLERDGKPIGRDNSKSGMRYQKTQSPTSNGGTPLCGSCDTPGKWLGLSQGYSWTWHPQVIH